MESCCLQIVRTDSLPAAADAPVATVATDDDDNCAVSDGTVNDDDDDYMLIPVGDWRRARECMCYGEWAEGKDERSLIHNTWKKKVLFRGDER